MQLRSTLQRNHDQCPQDAGTRVYPLFPCHHPELVLPKHSWFTASCETAALANSQLFRPLAPPSPLCLQRGHLLPTALIDLVCFDACSYHAA
jgi:hypothetical protein